MEVNYFYCKESIHCDICPNLCQIGYGVLKTENKLDSSGSNQIYEIFLCKSCFLGTVSYLKSQKELNYLFDENFDFTQIENLGLK
ncbi:hypothetical protein AWW73_18110 [Acinetobacter lactucae]|jgi:hypothetical protein|uniref:hypothetical protein n=1 Tax=Acinetobacter calcoaceticus/baumannii complex TaxID=909768 RepID=UPI0007A03F7F|nr:MULTISPECIES: hypothetical protein [Acinetobacter calcoaceticus/baumannii complex]KYQ79715.1 hypothetical protein AWW73_18110 [Acinetobacter lactucae]OCY34142.1 hypothetical protein BFR75_03500 [Acinetobacter pittii]